MRGVTRLWFGLFLTTVALADRVAELHLLDLGRYPGARCLDGSAAGFYLRNASAAENASRWTFSLEGGGECIDGPSCTSRSTTDLGSSLNWNKTMYLGQFQSDEVSHNPDFSTWSTVFIKYCSGDLHLGAQSSPGETVEGLQFSGHLIVEAVLDTLIASGDLARATEIVWSGDSAGGMGSFAHIDFVADKISGARVVGAPIGGFYFSNNWTYTSQSPAPVKYIPWTFEALEGYYKFWSAWVPTRCASSSEHAQAPWQCMISVASYATVKSEVFVIEAQTDEVVMPLHDGLPAVWNEASKECLNSVHGCPREIVDYMDIWRSHMWASLQQLVISSKRDGLFHPSCLMHCSFATTSPLIHDASYIQAFGDWMFGRGSRNLWVDTCGVMCNPTCQPRAQTAPIA